MTKRIGVLTLTGLVIVGIAAFAFGANAQIAESEQLPTTTVSEAPPSSTVLDLPIISPLIILSSTIEEPASPTDASTTETAIVNEPVATITTDTAPVSAPIVPIIPPVISTDKTDYHPGETALIYGSLFQPFQSIVLKIAGGDIENGTFTESSKNISADASGSFQSEYKLDEIFRPFYTVSALDTSGHELASMWFRDSAIGTYDQCSNDTGTGYASNPDTGCRWINGNLNANNSTYMEGDSTVQRLWIEGYAPGSTHTVTFQYGTTKSGKHAYDFLTSWDASESWIALADRCQDITGCTTAAETSLAIPHDPNGSGQFESGIRNFVMRGGVINSSTAPTIVSGSYSGDSETSITISFTVAGSGSMCETKQSVTSCGVAIWFGAHIAKTSEWNGFNGTTGAGSIAGSPYHVALSAEDGASVGQRDNQMQSNVVPTTITISKVTVPATTTPFSFVGTGSGFPTSFSLTNGFSTTTLVSSKQNQSYSITENSLAGWSLTDLQCTKQSTSTAITTNTSTRSVNITLGQDSDIIDCTFTNKIQLAKLTLIKTVNNDNGGTATATAWTLNASGPMSITGASGSGTVTNATVNAGTYALSETGGPAGYSAGNWSCVGGTLAGSNVTIAAGDNVTCTINNNDIAPSLTLNKIVVNNDGGTALESAWNISASGTTSISGPGAAGSADVVSGSGFSAGTYTLSESSGPAGYAASSWSCVKNNNAPVTGSSIDLALGDVAICTITNDDIAPTLKLIKNVVNNNGGTKSPSDWTLTASGTGGFSDNGGTGGFHSVKANIPYALSESSVSGYSSGSWSCDGGSLTGGNNINLGLATNVTCTITNTDQPATLIVKKIVINDNGGTAATSSFMFSVNGATSTNFNANGENNITVSAGTYNVTEPAVTGYATTYDNCSGIVIPNGGTATCTITNNDIAPKLTIIKHVINDNGGTKAAGDFVMAVTATNPSSSTFPGSEGGMQITLNAGSYSVSETQLPGYTMSTSTNCTGSIAIGEEKTCTITNDDQAAHLIVIKHVDNGSTGATTTAGAFTMHITGTAGTTTFAGADSPGVSTTVNAGNYIVSEDAVNGYTMSTSTDCTGTIANGETKTCTITNIAIAPKLTLNKIVINDNGGTATTSSFQAKIDNVNVPWEIAQTSTVGSHMASEVELAGYVSSTWSGDCATNGSITLSLGDVKACTITNDDQPGSIKIIKNAIGGNAMFDFNITGPSSSTQSVSTTAGTGNTGFITVNAGNYSITEAALAGWAMTSSSCTTGNPNGFTITNGGSVTCTFVNNKPAAKINLSPTTSTNKIGDDHVITANVQVQNGNGIWGPAADGTSVSFAITNSNSSTATFVGNDNCSTVSGICTITINSPTSGSVTVHASSSPMVLGVTLGVQTDGTNGNSGDAHKDYVNAKIAIASTATNEVGNSHTFTVTVLKDLGDGSGFVGIAGIKPTVTFLPSNPVTVTNNCSSTGTNSSGECTVVINSPIAGIFTAHATASTTISGVSFSLATNGTGGNSGDAVKTYVDAKLVLTPATATNEIGSPHTITATLTEDPGTGPIAASSTLITFSMPTSTASSTFVGGINTCTTNSSGECSIQINSDASGIVTVHGVATLTIGGVTITRSSDGTHGSSGDAAKTYVDAKIILDPLTATNNIGSPHTVTSTVYQNTGSGFVVVPNGTLVTFTLTNSGGATANFVGSSSCTTSAGSCAIQINSLTPGTVMIHASTTFMVGGISLTRVTDGTHGSTGDAQKTYVAGALEITKVVDLSGYLFATSTTKDFVINITGPSFQTGTSTIFHLVNGVLQAPTTTTLSPIIPGTYTVTEDPGIAWAVTGTGTVSVVANNTSTATITNKVKIPNTTISVTSSPAVVILGESLTLTISDKNDGAVPLSNNTVTLTFGTTTIVLDESSANFSGDTNNNHLMDPGETWTWTVPLTITTTTTFTVTGDGIDPLGNHVSPSSGYSSETQSITVNVIIPATRTLGFWQTHTSFTKYIFDNKLASSMPIGIAPHKGNLTTYGQVFGGFYAPIAKTSTGAKRSALDQARIQLLQQLLAAKLNCAAFGCSTATLQKIASADAAYAGTNVTQIKSFISQLDAYNNSGDTIAIPTILPAPGNATPKDSKDIAYIQYWDNP